MVEFRTDVFDAASIEALTEQLRRVLEAMIAEPTRRLTSVDLLDAANWPECRNRPGRSIGFPNINLLVAARSLTRCARVLRAAARRRQSRVPQPSRTTDWACATSGTTPMAPSCWRASRVICRRRASVPHSRCRTSAARRSKSRAEARSPLLQRIRAAVDERGDLLGVEVPWLRRLTCAGSATAARRPALAPAWNACHLRWL